MRILLQGAFNNNFGDNLFALLFYDSLKNAFSEDEIYFNESERFGIGDRLAREIGYTKKGKIKKADALVYFSGGYFGEKRNSIRETIGRYIVYCKVADRFKRNPIYIISVGAGPISNKFLRSKIVNIFSRAKLAIVRDEQSAKYLQEYGVKNQIVVSTDTALLINKSNVGSNTFFESIPAGKRIFFHISQLNTDEIDKISYAIIDFLESNDWSIYVGYDGYSKNAERLDVVNHIKSIIGENKVIYYEYKTAKDFCAFLNEMDMIITPKLHVGIVSSCLGKSVISFPHHQKIKRYYSQIGYGNRCYQLSDLSSTEIAHLLDVYKDDPVIVPKNYREMAQNNIDSLIHELRTLKRKIDGK